MNIDALKAEYAARGGKVQRIATGKRAAPRKVMRDLTRDDNRRAIARALWAQFRNGESK